MMKSKLEQIEMRDISEEHRDIAEALGMDNFRALVGLCGGQDIYIPKADTLFRSARNRELYSRFDGANTRQLAREYNLTERRVRDIIRSVGQAHAFTSKF